MRYALLALTLAAFGGLLVTRKMYFKPEEFGGWYGELSPRLLFKLNQFREAWGAPVVVSQNVDAVGRHGGDSNSQHNVDKWREVRAIDVFPEGMNSVYDMQRARAIAKDIGFTGIGLYTDTSKPMLHLDVRDDRVAGDPAEWSRIAGDYRAIEEVLV